MIAPLDVLAVMPDEHFSFAKDECGYRVLVRWFIGKARSRWGIFREAFYLEPRPNFITAGVYFAPGTQTVMGAIRHDTFGTKRDARAALAEIGVAK